MGISLLGFLVFLAVPLLLGSALLRSLGIGPRTDVVAYGGWVWMSGALALAALEGLRLLTGLGSPAGLAALALLASAALFFGARRKPLLAPQPTTDGAGRLERVFYGLAVALALLVLLQLALNSSQTVIHANDEANFWSLRAKLLYDAQGFGGTYAHAVRTSELPNASYPLLNPLLQLWVFDCAGGITHVANRFPIQLCVLALVLCSASAFRRASRPWVAGVLVLALANCAPMGAAVRQANSDALVGLGALVAADAWQRAWQGGRGAPAAERNAWVGLGALALGFVLASKREGALLLLAAAPALVLCSGWREVRRNAWAVVRAALPWSAVPLGVWLATQLHNGTLAARGAHGVGPGVLAGTLEHLGDLRLVLSFLLDLATRPLLSGIPAVFALLALLVWPRPRNALAFVPLALLLFLLAFGVAVVHRGKADYLLGTAGVRVVFQLVPLALLWIASVTPGLLASLRPGARGAQGSEA